jgi:hypothetical protein
MSYNPYTPPTAAVGDGPAVASAQPLFFAVSPLKLVVMSTCTLGLYQLYWLYRNWVLVRARERSRIVPALRAIFGVFFIHALFTRIDAAGTQAGIKPPLATGALTAAWILLTFASRLPDPYWVVWLLLPFAMVPVQSRVRAIHSAVAPDAPANDRFTGLNWLAIVPGCTLLVFAVIGLFQPEPAAG